ncbi:hypothetical protein CRZ11_22000 [Salmonella enterica]|nr:hypothetical protein [Salmonella enterica]EFT8085246.1 hypothetical protein [Salmonella enterica]EFT8117957.1 hypothetical protein [Salmonella enterica]
MKTGGRRPTCLQGNPPPAPGPHGAPQPDAAGGHKRLSAEAAGRQHLPAGFHPATWPERTSGSRRDAATRGRR